MELYQEMLVSMVTGLSKEEARVFVQKLGRPSEFLECASYRALQTIKAILEDDSLSDAECFLKMEGIVHEFEKLGSNCGSRHDFG